MSRYILAPAAHEDLVAIQDYYLEKAGYRIARQMLVEFMQAFQAIAHTRHRA
jgi:plasmid stabilization system protein ParE